MRGIVPPRRHDPRHDQPRQPDARSRCSSPTAPTIEVDRTDELVAAVRATHGIDALITIGGDGSLTIGNRLHQAGLRVIGVPKTIDNDLDKTHQTFGFDTAVGFASECIDRLFSTATSHGRVIVVEVMGRYAGWIALEAGMASSAHAILIPEIPFDLEPVAATIAQREQRGAKFSIVVVAEGAAPVGGHVSVIGKAVGQAERLGGIGGQVAARARGADRQGGPHGRARAPPARRLADRRSTACSGCASAPRRCGRWTTARTA